MKRTQSSPRTGRDGPFREVLSRLKRSLSGKSYPLHRNEQFFPFFIIGPPRSGNTLLRRILHRHPDLHIPPETYVLGPVIRYYKRNRNTPWPDIVRFVLAAFEYHPAFESFGITLRPLENALESTPLNERSLACIINSLYRFHGEKSGRDFRRWGDKTTENDKWLGEILSVFPDAQFLFIFRDGADAVHSLIQSGLQPDLNSAADRWTRSVAHITEFEKEHPERGFRLLYEDLVQQPEKTVRNVCGFLNIDFTAVMLHSDNPEESMPDLLSEHYTHLKNVLNPINTKSIGQGRALWTAEERAFLQNRIGIYQKNLGYPSLTI